MSPLLPPYVPGRDLPQPKRNHAKYEVTQGADGQWYWRLRAANGRIVASGEGFTSRWHANRAITAHMDAAKDAAGQWLPVRWRSS